mmetsp:Transcript_3750/g.11044  ORF Transcript_3750/g.11044 Transcript_3750/m.11044 type:complete len:106 (+) Transcript_3750:173-490(+)
MIKQQAIVGQLQLLDIWETSPCLSTVFRKVLIVIPVPGIWQNRTQEHSCPPLQAFHSTALTQKLLPCQNRNLLKSANIEDDIDFWWDSKSNVSFRINEFLKKPQK